MNEALIKFEREQENLEVIEHNEVLLAIRTILKTKEGIKLFNYFFKNLEVMTAPERGIQGNDLHEYLGYLRAGNSIYKLACEADSETSASILAKLERKRYEYIYEKYRIENGIGNEDTDSN